MRKCRLEIGPVMTTGRLYGRKNSSNEKTEPSQNERGRGESLSLIQRSDKLGWRRSTVDETG